MKRLLWTSLLILTTMTINACSDDGDDGDPDAGAPAATCESVCALHTECLVTDPCIEACEAEEEPSKEVLVACLNDADPSVCDDVFACLPPDAPEGACFYVCEENLINSCTAGTGVTEEACTEAANEDCGGAPDEVAFLPDCGCEGEGDCAPPAFSTTD